MQTTATHCPSELIYTSTHEWIRRETDGSVYLGITEHAQEQLGDIVFVDLPDIDSTFSEGDEIAVIESVKTAADIYTPITGTIIAINPNLNETPELINSDSYHEGWLVQIQPDNEAELTSLLSAEQYQNNLTAE